MKQFVKVAIVVVLVAAVTAAGVYAWDASSPGSSKCSGVTVASQPAPAAPNRPAAAASSAHLTPVVTISHSPPRAQSASSSGVIKVVAAENFWGSLVSQLGGNQTSVLSIVTDPNSDPHEYEANTSDAIAIAQAQFVIVNGVGYDDWALQLISAGGNPNQTVLNVGDLVGVTIGGGVVNGNPHMWYNPKYVNETVAAMYSDLVHIAPSHTAYFQQQYAALNASLGPLYSRANTIKQLFAGTIVAATEDIFVYLANYTGLDLISPPEFMQAVAEGNDPSPQSVVTFQCQLESGKVAVLVYNQQTVTPTTIQMKSIAAANNVTIVGVTETIQPPDVTFQVWMNSEYLALQNALNAKALGQ
jgi:zinc/manganese transport system substrate-binding protein